MVMTPGQSESEILGCSLAAPCVVLLMVPPSIVLINHLLVKYLILLLHIKTFDPLSTQLQPLSHPLFRILLPQSSKIDYKMSQYDYGTHVFTQQN